MIRTFLFVSIRSFKNRIISRARRLRQPRYLISFLAGLAYVWFAGFRRVFVARHGAAVGVVIPATAFVSEMLSLMMLTAMVVVWALPDSAGGLTFSEAEIQFLFPAPISRRELLLYRLMREQVPMLISALAMTLLGFRRSGFIGVWLGLATMSLYFTVVRLGRARLKLMGIGFVTRLAIVAVICAVLSVVISRDVTSGDHASIRSALQRGDSAKAITTAGFPLRAPLTRAILFVPHIFAHAAMPLNGTQLLVSCAALALMAIALVEVAARLNVAFEEASLKTSQVRGSWRSRVRMRRTGQYVMFRRIPPVFRLRSGAPPELAIIWKNLIASLRTSAAWAVVLLVLFAVMLVQTFMTKAPVAHLALATMALFLCGLFPLIGSNMFQHDMRMDVARFELLKTYPLSGEHLVGAEMTAPLMIVSAIEIILLLATEVMLHVIDLPATGPVRWFATPEFAVTAVLLALPVCALQLLIRNAVPVVLPGWAMRSSDDVRGFAVFGQRLVILAVNLFVLMIGLIPAAVVFFGIFLTARHFAPGNLLFALAAATVPAAALLAAETWAGVKILGAQFEKIDVSTEMDTVAV